MRREDKIHVYFKANGWYVRVPAWCAPHGYSEVFGPLSKTMAFAYMHSRIKAYNE